MVRRLRFTDQVCQGRGRASVLTLTLAFAMSLVLAWALAGCATMGESPASLPPVGTAYARGVSHPLSRTELRDLLAKTRVLVVGEVHDHPGHHQVQLDLLKAMADTGGPLVVGIEWLDQSAQPACERLGVGEVGVEEFARLVDWEHAWGFPLELYAPILEEVRARRLRLVALNAPLAVVRQVARSGLASLEPSQRALLAPALDLKDQAYRARLDAQFAMHGFQDPLSRENFFAAQVSRDETMAHNLAGALHPWPDSDVRAVVLAGGGHLAHGEGLPPRISRRLPGSALVTALAVPAEAAPDLTASDPEGWPADILVVSAPAPPKPPRLGVVLQEVPAGLLIERVLAGSAAARAGWRAGDVLISLDGAALSRIKQIHDLVRDAPWAPHTYRIKRGDTELDSAITLGGGER